MRFDRLTAQQRRENMLAANADGISEHDIKLRTFVRNEISRPSTQSVYDQRTAKIDTIIDARFAISKRYYWSNPAI